MGPNLRGLYSLPSWLSISYFLSYSANKYIKIKRKIHIYNIRQIMLESCLILINYKNYFAIDKIPFMLRSFYQYNQIKRCPINATD